MENEAEERFVFLVIADGDMNEAQAALDAVPRYRDDTVRFGLLRDAVISYSRPFKRCNGKYVKEHRLGADVVPQQYEDLHKRLLGYRDQITAHLDIDVRDPTLIRRVLPGAIGFKAFSPGAWFQETEQIVSLIHAVRSILKVQIEQMRSELDL